VVNTVQKPWIGLAQRSVSRSTSIRRRRIMEATDAGFPSWWPSPKAFPRSTWYARRDSSPARRTRLIVQLPGIFLQAKCKIWHHACSIHLQGHVGVVSRSGTLTYEAVGQLTRWALDNPPALVSVEIPSCTNFVDACGFSMTTLTPTAS